jgi:predicted PurR-regulated permease PerM
VSETSPVSVRTSTNFRGLYAAAALVVVVAGLREASGILVPVVFAAFITVLLSPAVRFLRRLGVPVAIAIPLLVMGLIALLALAGSFVWTNINAFAVAIPRYQTRVLEIVESLTLWLGGHGIRINITKLLASIDVGNVLALVGNALTQVASLLSYTILVLLLVVFLLFDPEEPRRRAGASATCSERNQTLYCTQDIPVPHNGYCYSNCAHHNGCGLRASLGIGRGCPWLRAQYRAHRG